MDAEEMWVGLQPDNTRQGKTVAEEGGKMSTGTARKADTGKTVWRYERRCPERTPLYQLVTEHYPRFLDLLGFRGQFT